MTEADPTPPEDASQQLDSERLDSEELEQVAGGTGDTDDRGRPNPPDGHDLLPY